MDFMFILRWVTYDKCIIKYLEWSWVKIKTYEDPVDFEGISKTKIYMIFNHVDLYIGKLHVFF